MVRDILPEWPCIISNFCFCLLFFFIFQRKRKRKRKKQIKIKGNRKREGLGPPDLAEGGGVLSRISTEPCLHRLHAALRPAPALLASALRRKPLNHIIPHHPNDLSCDCFFQSSPAYPGLQLAGELPAGGTARPWAPKSAGGVERGDGRQFGHPPPQKGATRGAHPENH